MKNKASFLSIAAAVTLTLTGCVTINRASDEPSPQVTTVVVTPETSSPAPTEASSAEAPQDTATSAPATQTQAPQPAAPEGVAPGTSCGPSNTGRTTLVVAENAANLNCAQVQSIFADFNAAFANGGATHHQIQGFACHTRSPGDVEIEGRSVTCTQGGTRLEAMTQFGLGGVPVANPRIYVDGEYGLGADFSTSFADCSMGGVDAYGFGCTYYPDGKNPVSAGIALQVLGNATPGPGTRELAQRSPRPGFVQLPVGQSFYYKNIACINNGDSVTCVSGDQGFTVTQNGHTFH